MPAPPLDFPSTPAVGDHWPVPQVPGQPVYTWDGEKWTTKGGTLDSGGVGTALPLMDATPALVGTATKYSREDHVHPTDTTRAPNATTIKSVHLQKFVASGTYTPSAGMLNCTIECWGGGGGGGSAQGALGSTVGGGGGGAGGKSVKLATATDIGASKAVTIGAGGAGGTNTPAIADGAAGGDTSVGTLCVAKGGQGGVRATAGVAPVGGQGGVPGTGDIAGPGQPGSGGVLFTGAVSAFPSGHGGSAEYGAGGIGITTGSGGISTGNGGTGYGAGGSGASINNFATSTVGGNGMGGLVKITEFCTQ